ncbi:MAG TPA: hypothetical protein GX500_04765 [Firmicutes bacterium]|nr:hypothetical protein [Candidatus Fermentithermobacillaceae bacterium]
MARFKAFAQGLVLTAIACAVSAAVSFWGLKRTYYLAVMLPVCMSSYVLLAWFTHLRKTGFLAYYTPSTESVTDIDEDKASGAELLGRRDPSGLLRRRPDLPDNRVESFLKNPIPALLWSAFQLALLATFLYWYFGVGASYYF